MNQLIENKSPKDTRVVVAMSGGVDSSTVAAMLVAEDYEVIGITLQLYDHGSAVKSANSCCAGQDIEDARAVADKLGIPHYVLDYESLFKQSVMDDFADSYIRGETPIPCVRCNQTVKFRDLLKMAKDLNADCLATGHYIRRDIIDGKAVMLRGVDHNKDQSYFLFATTQDQIDFLRFPLGHLNKTQTRALAEKYNLPVADKPDSQDICFVPNGDYASIVEKLRPGALDKGDIIHIDGTIMGEHNGIINYTIGQRKGLGIAHHEPLYVIKIDPDTKQVIVGPESELATNILNLTNINWLGDNIESQDISIKIRSTQEPFPAKITRKDNNEATVALHQPQKTTSPGQACVFYDDDIMLGGGWISAI